jgi:hypothetical protein
MEYFVLRLARSTVSLLGVRQHRFADRGTMRRLASADAGGYRGGHPVADLLQVHDVGAVEDCQVHDQPGGAMQIVEEWDRRAVKPVLVHREGSEFDQPHAEFVVAAVAAKPP